VALNTIGKVKEDKRDKPALQLFRSNDTTDYRIGVYELGGNTRQFDAAGCPQAQTNVCVESRP
jgi:hypothetical protein